MKTLINIICQTDDGQVIINSTIVQLLTNVHAAGSITGAAKLSNLSYKRTWDLLDQLNLHLVTPAISTSIGGEGGGGTHLTPTGLAIISTYHRMVHLTDETISPNFDIIARHVKQLQV